MLNLLKILFPLLVFASTIATTIAHTNQSNFQNQTETVKFSSTKLTYGNRNLFVIENKNLGLILPQAPEVVYGNLAEVIYTNNTDII